MKRFLKWVALFFAATTLYSLFCAFSIVRYAGKDEATPADCIIVLGAGTNGKTPNAVFRERLHHAVMLYENGYSDTILLTGGYSPGNERSDAAIAGAICSPWASRKRPFFWRNNPPSPRRT